MWPFSHSNSDVIEQKRAERNRAIADVDKRLVEQQSQAVYLRSTGLLRFASLLLYSLIAILTASEIVLHIEKGEWTASDVLEAYISRAIYAQEKTNSLTEGLYAQHL